MILVYYYFTFLLYNFLIKHLKMYVYVMLFYVYFILIYFTKYYNIWPTKLKQITYYVGLLIGIFA